MEATIRKDNDKKVTLILDGRLDTSVTTQTEQEVEPLYEFKDCEIVIDCSRLNYISSSGLRLLMTINQRTRANHCDLYIKGLQKAVYEVFMATGFAWASTSLRRLALMPPLASRFFMASLCSMRTPSLL